MEFEYFAYIVLKQHNLYIYTCIVRYIKCRKNNKNFDNRSSFVMLLNVSYLIDVILYWNANNCQIKKYTSMLQTLILYVVVFQRNILNKP